MGGDRGVGLAPDETDVSTNGTNVAVSHTGDTTYWAASDLNAAELSAFAKLFAAAP